jgi:hypothetical protein
MTQVLFSKSLQNFPKYLWISITTLILNWNYIILLHNTMNQILFVCSLCVNGVSIFTHALLEHVLDVE